MIVENPLNFIVSVLLGGIGLALLGFTMLVYLAGYNADSTAEKILTQGVSNTGVIWLDDYYTDEGWSFRKQAFESDKISSIGMMGYKGVDGSYLPELYQIQYNHGVNQDNMGNENNLQMLNLDQEVLSLCKLEYEDYIPVDKLDFSDESVEYLYLGNAYREISIGTEFRDTSYNPGTIYKVAGILKKGTRFASVDLLHGIEYTNLQSDINMDYEIICVNHGISLASPWIFSVDRNFTMEEGERELSRIADRVGISIQNQYGLKSVFKDKQKETKIMQDTLTDMLYLIIIVLIIVVITLQVVQIFHHSHSYGIMYSIGINTPEIVAMIIIRNMIYFVFSLCSGAGILFWIGKRYFITNVQIKEVFFHLLLRQVIPISTIILAVIFIIVTVIPCAVFSKQDPIKMIQGEK